MILIHYWLWLSQTEAELQELINEVEENPAPADAPQPPAPKSDAASGGKSHLYVY